MDIIIAATLNTRNKNEIQARREEIRRECMREIEHKLARKKKQLKKLLPKVKPQVIATEDDLKNLK